jgi:O-antigen ligase
MRVFRWCVMGTIAWGVLAFGAVYPWAYWPLAGASAASGGWAIAATGAWRDPRARRLAVALSVLVAAIGVQIVSLPYGVVAWLSPAVDEFLRAFELGFRPEVRHTLSLEPEHTAAALLLAAALSLLLVGLMRAVRHLPLEWLVSQLMGLGAALAIFGIVQKGFLDPNAPLVYGFWQPRELGSPFGPFINRNHFAGWMVMVLPIVTMYAVAVLHGAARLRTAAGAPAGAAGGLRWLTTVEGNRVLLIAFMAMVMGVALVLTTSRSGLASFAVASVLMLWFVCRRLAQRRHRIAAGLYVGSVLVGAVLWAGGDMVARRLTTSHESIDSRLSAWNDTIQIARDFPIFGVGLGAYGRAMLMYQTQGRELMYAQAHNDYLQLAAEGGLLVGVPALAVLVLVVQGISRRLRSDDDDELTYWIRRGAVAGLAGIAVQSAVEFSLQMPGNALLCVVLVAIAVHRPRQSAHARRV